MSNARDPRPERRERLERAAHRHGDVPDAILQSQVARAVAALDLLGDDDEMVATAIDALDRNLDSVERALHTGAVPAHAVPGPHPPAGKP